MVLTKIWIAEQITDYESRKSNSTDPSETIRLDGIIQGLKLVYVKLVEPPIKPETSKQRNIDIEKGYENIVKFYMEKKGYTKEQANEIAIKVMSDQNQTRL